MTVEQTILYLLGFALTFSFCGAAYLSATVRLSLILIFAFLFIPLDSSNLVLASNISLLKIENYSEILKYLSIGASHGVILSLAFYVARLFSFWLVSLVLDVRQGADSLKTIDNFVAIVMAFLFFKLLDLDKFGLLIQSAEKFNLENTKNSILSIAQHSFYAAFGFFILYVALHFIIYLIFIVANKYLKDFLSQDLVSSLSFSILVLILSLSLYPMSSEIGQLIETSFEMISR